MAAEIIDGKQISADIRAEVARGSQEDEGRSTDHARTGGGAGGRGPGVPGICEQQGESLLKIGFKSIKYVLPAETSEEDLLALVDELNERMMFTACWCSCLCQSQIDEDRVILTRSIPTRTSTGFIRSTSAGSRLELPVCRPARRRASSSCSSAAAPSWRAPTPSSSARSNNVGKPAALLLLAAELHRHHLPFTGRRNLAEVCRRADILVAAVGVPMMINGDMVKEGATVIDVGIHRTDDRPVRRCRFRAGLQKGTRHHAGSGRRRSHDHRHADEKYLKGGRADALEPCLALAG